MNLEPQQASQIMASEMLDDLQKKRDEIFASVKWSILYGELDRWFGKILELEPLPLAQWVISQEKSKPTGIAWFKIESEKHKGDIRVEWEQYRNGAYSIQVIDNADGFEIFNRSPSIIPPDIEIDPGTYVCRYGAFRCHVMTFNSNQWTLDYVDSKGFIHWEHRARFQMVGKRLNVIAAEERSRVKVLHGYAVTDWKKSRDTYYRIKKVSETELEFMMGEMRKMFIRELRPRVKGTTGYAYESGERIKGCRHTWPNHTTKSDPSEA